MDNEDLIDYEEEVPQVADATVTNGASATDGAANGAEGATDTKKASIRP